MTTTARPYNYSAPLVPKGAKLVVIHEEHLIASPIIRLNALEESQAAIGRVASKSEIQNASSASPISGSPFSLQLGGFQQVEVPFTTPTANIIVIDVSQGSMAIDISSVGKFYAYVQAPLPLYTNSDT